MMGTAFFTETEFFNEIFRINRAHCAAQGLDTTPYDRPLSATERLGSPLSAEEIDRLPRIVRLHRHCLSDTVAAEIRRAKNNRALRAQRERDAWYIDPTPFRRLARVERIVKQRGEQS